MQAQFTPRRPLPTRAHGMRFCAAALLLAALPVFAADPCQTAPVKELPPDALPEEVEAALVEALARSLQAFEGCLPDVSASPMTGNAGRQGGAMGSGAGSGSAYGSGEGQGGGASSGRTGQDGRRGAYGDSSFPSNSATAGRSVADGARAQSSPEYSASGSGTSSASAYGSGEGQAGEAAFGRTGQAGQRGAYGDSSLPSSPETGGRGVADGTRAHSPYERGTNTPRGGVRSRGCGGRPCPDPSIEDDVARKLRRAAEAEPNPEVRSQLWAQYHRYMNP